jgi:hypothetical protein
MSEETKKELDELKFRINVNREMNNMLDCLFSRDDKRCNQCEKVNTCSFLMDAVFVYRNQTKQHDPHG